MNTAAKPLPRIIDRHPELVAELAKAQANDWPLYPLKNLCGFLLRLEHRFPAMRVLWLRPFGDSELTGGEWSLVGFVWSAQAILEAGLLSPEAMPQGRKRICSSTSADAEVSVATVARSKGSFVQVSLRLPPSLSADHPLAFFSATNVRRKAVPPYLRLVANNLCRRSSVAVGLNEEHERKAQVAMGTHGPVTASARWISARSAEIYYGLGSLAAINIRFNGHRDDLVSAGCITPDRLTDWRDIRHDDGFGGHWHLESKAGPKRRGWAQVSYYVVSRALARTLPAMLDMFPEGLSNLSAPPSLRLVADDARKEPQS